MNPMLPLVPCEFHGEAGWDFTGLSRPAWMVTSDTVAGVTTESWMIHKDDLANFRNVSQAAGYAGPLTGVFNATTFLNGKGVVVADYRLATMSVQSFPVATMPNPQGGPNTRFTVVNGPSTVQGMLFRSDNAGAWQDTWALKPGFKWGDSVNTVAYNQDLSQPANPATWATQAKTFAAGGTYIQVSYSWATI